MIARRASVRAALLLAAAVLPAVLGGCAAALIPVVAGSAVLREAGRDKQPEAPPTPSPTPVAQAPAPRPEPQVFVEAAPAEPAPAPAPGELPPLAATAALPSATLPAPAWSLPPGTAQPVQSAQPAQPAPVATPPVAQTPAPASPGADAIIAAATPATRPLDQMAPGGDYGAFTRFALDKARPYLPGEPRASVVVQPGSSIFAPRWLDCSGLAPAVIVDLDPGGAVFAPAAPGRASAGLVEALAALRAAGVTVLWASDLTVADAQAIYVRLRETGLDPAGTDRLLLNRRPDERKQTRRAAAARDYCINAMTGDRRGDFDEMFDYLLDQSNAAALEPTFGAGWFITPAPIQPTS